MIHKFIFKKGGAFLILLSICSCSAKHPLVGTWQASHYSYWEQGIAYLKGIRSFTTGAELDVNTDSTFKASSCGGFAVGKWHVKGDSLFLAVDTFIWKNNEYRKLADIPMKHLHPYAIHKNKLVFSSKGTFSIVKRDPKDSSLKLVNSHQVYMIEILKPVN